MSSFEFINVEAPSQPLPPPNAYKNVKFARITEQDVSGKKKAPMNARSEATVRLALLPSFLMIVGLTFQCYSSEALDRRTGG